MLSPAVISHHRGKPWAHLAGRSMHGGSGQTWRELYRLGLLSADDKLTERGRYEAAARVSRKGGVIAARRQFLQWNPAAAIKPSQFLQQKISGQDQ